MMAQKQAHWSRSDFLETASNTKFDLLVVGGGITGAGIALDAASRGMRVLLLDMQDFGAGTSSRSTKLIHGGLRYLKQFEFRLVREVGRERAILHKNAPHVVIPEKMLLPIYKGGTFNKLSLWLGLWLYDRLAGVKKEERRVILGREKALAREPQLGKQGLRGAGLYSEYRTDDARLTIEVLKTAIGFGAICINYAEVVDLTYENGKVAGVTAIDRLHGQQVELKAAQVVNAAGPWVDGIRKMDGSARGKRLHHSKGVHIVVPHHRLPLRQASYIDAEGGRMIFVIPRGKFTYIGTTDTSFKGDLSHPRVTMEDVDYLLKAANRTFSRANLTAQDINSSWVGIRPLIHEEGKSPSELSRKDELFYSDTGLVTIAGGKLTGFRKMAEKVVDVIAERMRKQGKEVGKCRTKAITLTGGDLGGSKSLQEFAEQLALKTGVELEEVEWLAGIYGDAAEGILAEAASIPGEAKVSILRAAFRHSLRAEGGETLGAFFIRRTGLLYFGRDWIKPVLGILKLDMEDQLGAGHPVDPNGEFDRAYKDAIDFLEAEEEMQLASKHE